MAVDDAGASSAGRVYTACCNAFLALRSKLMIIYGSPFHKTWTGVKIQEALWMSSSALKPLSTKPNSLTWQNGTKQALQDGNPYAFVTILLSQLHNIHSLQLDYSFCLVGLP